METSVVKQNIIETASALFYRNGYNSTGINEIIAKSGIAKATLYHHFRSKEDICLGYLKYKNTTFLTDVRAYCAARPSGKAQLLALFDFLQAFFQDKDFNGCWCIKTIAEIPKDNERIRDEIQAQKRGLLLFIEELLLQNDCVPSTLPPSALARQIYLLYESAVAESHLHQADWPIQEAKNLCTHILT